MKIIRLIDLGSFGSQSVRVYSIYGISPALDTRPGGDVKIFVEQEIDNMDVIGGIYLEASKRFQRGLLKQSEQMLKSDYA